MGRVVVLVAASALLLVVVFGTAAAAPGEPLLVGFSEDLPKEIGPSAVSPAADLGGSSFRLTTLWAPGQTAVAAGEAVKLGRAVAATSSQRLVISVFADSGSKAPQDAAARDTYCGYLRTVLSRYPSIRDVVIWNEPNKSLFWSPQLASDGSQVAAASYQRLLARCYDVLHAAFANVNVIGLALSSTGNDNAGSASPGAFIRGVGDAYRASGRGKPLMDTVAFHPYGMDATERPWRQHIGSKTIGQGDWNKLMYNLQLAFAGTAQRVPGQGSVRIWYTETGVQTAVDASKVGAYTGTENVKTVPDFAGGEPDSPPPSDTSPARDQATQALDAIRLAACQPYVAAYFNFLLADEPRLSGWQSGAYWADLSPKDSVPAFRQAIAEARSGAVACDALKGGRPSADFMPPGQPSNLTGAARTQPLRVELRWSAASDDTGVTTYQIYRNGAHVGTTSITEWTNVAVTPNTSYVYSVRALDAASNLGNASASTSVTTPADTPPDTVAPSPPASLAAVAGSRPPRVDLTWAFSTDDVGVAGYEVYRDGGLLATVLAGSYTDASVGSAVPYTYWVVAFDQAGNRSAASPAVAATTLDSLAPTAPGSLTAAGRSAPTRIELTWTPATDDVSVTGYEIRRNGALLGATIGTSYTDAGISAGVEYTYSVRASDAAGNLGPEATATARIGDSQAPSTPGSFSATAFSFPRRVQLSWAASTDNVGVTGYRVYRDGLLVRTLTTTAYIDYLVVRRTRYSYAVRAIDAAGNQSAATASINVTTLP